ncbi:MAG: arginine--tRNA ligase, partial [Chlamydiia bacterium]|nr:arginine--tRNA ligase [Chlamydiia bacterium]
MEALESTLKNFFVKAGEKAFPGAEMPIDLKPSARSDFGHYQFNSAMRLGKQLGKNPREVATELCAAAGESPLIEKLEVAGPGFINIWLSKEALSERVQKMLQDQRLGVPLDRPQRIVMDFSSPNTAKEMHVGHLRSTIIGDALARTFEFMGHDVLRLNHIGDWGTAFGMLIAYLKEEAPAVIQGTEETDLTHLVNWYRASKKRFDEDPAFKERAQKEVVKLQSGDREALRAWEIICEISGRAYQEIYDILDVKLVDRGESFYNPLLADTIKELESKGLISISDGAKCIFIEGFKNRDGDPLPLMVQKSDGGYGYASTDMASIKHRLFDEKGERLIYITDLGQGTHFDMVFKAAEMAGWLDPKKVRVEHVGFGMVLGPDGKKFRTRAGETEKLIDLITAAVDRARAIIREKNPDYPPEEVDKIAKAVGIGAIKYADLSTNRTGDYTFSYDKMLRFEGNTAAYLLYSYVRVNGIKRKVGVEVEKLLGQPIVLEHPAEIALALHLCQLPEALAKVEEELLPNRLTDYLYGLADKFHTFFHDCRVEGSEQETSRLLLCEATA